MRSRGCFGPIFRPPECRKPFLPKVRPHRRCSGAAGSSTDHESIGIHSNGIGTIPMERIGMQCIAIHSIPMDSKRSRNTVGDRLGKRQRGPGAGHYNAGKSVKSPGGEAHAQLRCLWRRTGVAGPRSHTIYVKRLYRIAVPDHCDHHIIRLAVAAVPMTEVRAGPVRHRLRPYAGVPTGQDTVDATYSVTPPTRHFLPSWCSAADG